MAKDGKYSTLGERARPFIYQPLLQNYESRMTLVVRTATDPTALVDAVRSQIQVLEPNLPVAKINTLAEQVSLSLLPARLTAALLGVFGLLALCLATVGIYGVVAYSVSQRTHEIGIRMALGARPSDVMKMVFREGLGVVTIGIAMGWGLPSSRPNLISSFLYGVSATDRLRSWGYRCC